VRLRGSRYYNGAFRPYRISRTRLSHQRTAEDSMKKIKSELQVFNL